jgi:CheY-like chemotaxis protein
MLVAEAIELEKLPLEVHIVSDGQQAIDFLARAERDANAPCPHLMLLDLNLPKRSGFEVLRRLRASERWRSLPVLVITSSDSREDLSEAEALGAGYFRKPPNYEEFLKLGAVLKQLLNANW